MKRLCNRKLWQQVRTSRYARRVGELPDTRGVDTARGSPARHLSMAASHPAKLARGLSLAALVTVSAVAAEEKALEPYIVNGVNTQQHPSTAALLYNSGGDAAYPTQICTATLIGCETILTAGHCVDSGAAQNYSVYFQHAGVFDVSSITLHPDYMLPFADVAVLKLASPVTGITPSPVNQIDPVPFIPYPGEIVGFGLTTFPGGDNGIKRYGTVSTEDCAARSITVTADFETPDLGGATSVAFPDYVDADTSVRFTAVADHVSDEVIGLVTNQATTACVDPADTNQKLGTGIDSSPGSMGFSGFAIRADFPGPLPRGATISAQFQTIAGVPLRVRVFDEAGNEVGATQAVAGPASGTCGNPGDARARTTVMATALAPASYAILDLAQFTSAYVFVIDDFSLSINFNNTDHICWRYEDPVGLPGQDSDTCKGDSGGPLFMDFGAGDAVAGVTSLGFGPGALCMPGGMSIDTNVFAYRCS